MNSQHAENTQNGMEIMLTEDKHSQPDVHLTKLERRRRIEELFEERRLREELEDFEF
jgi:hypothetical protein